MEATELDWQTSDGLKIYARAWQPPGAARAVVCLVHGHGEHGGRYAHVAQALNQAGYALVAPDLRGHGRSEGPRGHVPSVEALMEDVAGLLRQAGQRFPGRPCFLYGHSLGGLLVLHYALRRKPNVQGIIASGPLLRTPLEQQTLKVAAARLLNRLMPTLAMHSGLQAEALSRDPAVAQAYVGDPLVHDLITVRLAVEILAAGRYALEHAADFPPLPLLLMHGSADRLCLVEATRTFAGRLDGLCTLKVWEGLYHEIHNEPEQGQVLRFMIDWLDAHTAAA